MKLTAIGLAPAESVPATDQDGYLMPTATTANALSTLAVDNEGYLQAGCLL
jgi:hypothetical protein